MAAIIPDKDAKAAALAVLEAGEVVARIFEAKGRPRFNPLIAHVSSLEMARAVALFDPLSQKLADAFWPGPLTLVLPLREGAAIHPLVTAGLSTIALRMPKGFGGELIAALGRPLAAPSANSSGRVSATTAAAVAADLGSRIPLIVDGGPTTVGVESAVLDLSRQTPVILRPGAVTTAMLRGVLPELDSFSPPLVLTSSMPSPGMLHKHYSPRAPLTLYEGPHAIVRLVGECTTSMMSPRWV